MAIESLKRKGLRLGKNVNLVGAHTIFIDPSVCYLISIGDNCTICPNVRLIAHDASTKNALGYSKIGKIDIKENCFIGDSAIILLGVTIGANSIVGAGSVVNKDIPSGAVVAGNPIKIIRSTDDYIQKIEQISRKKKIFDESYYINKLDDKKRLEVIKSIQDSMGFMV